MDNKQQKQVKTLSLMRWAAIIPGLIMYSATLDKFGYNWALTLSFLAVMGFCYICSKERRMILCESIVADIKKELQNLGHEKAVYELKNLKSGIIVRVYLIGAGAKAYLCNRAVIETLSRGWYSGHISITQIVDLASEADIREAKETLDEDLLDEMRDRLKKGDK